MNDRVVYSSGVITNILIYLLYIFNILNEFMIAKIS